MVKVIKPGRPKEVICTGLGNGGHGCGATLAYDASDVYDYAGVPGESWGSREPVQCIKCPECRAITDLVRDERVNSPQNTWTYSWYKDKPESDNGAK